MLKPKVLIVSVRSQACAARHCSLPAVKHGFCQHCWAVLPRKSRNKLSEPQSLLVNWVRRRFAVRMIQSRQLSRSRN